MKWDVLLWQKLSLFININTTNNSNNSVSSEMFNVLLYDKLYDYHNINVITISKGYLVLRLSDYLIIEYQIVPHRYSPMYTEGISDTNSHSDLTQSYYTIMNHWWCKLLKCMLLQANVISKYIISLPTTTNTTNTTTTKINTTNITNNTTTNTAPLVTATTMAVKDTSSISYTESKEDIILYDLLSVFNIYFERLRINYLIQLKNLTTTTTTNKL